MKRELIVNLNRRPRIKGLDLVVGFDKVVKNEKGGRFPVKQLLEKMSLHFSDKQLTGGLVGTLLLKTVPEKIMLLNSAFLDWLMKHQNFIPESWKGNYTFFAGTVFMKDGVEVIRGIYHGDYGWATTYRWLDRGFYVDSPIAVMAIEE